MPVIRENAQLAPSQLRAHMNRLQQTMLLHPGGVPRVDPFFVRNDRPDEWHLSWIDPQKLFDKQQRYRGALEVVRPATAKKEYGIEPYECHGDRVLRHGLMLVRVPTGAYQAYRAAKELQALTGARVDLAQFKQQTNRPDMLQMGDDEMALPIAPPGGVFQRVNPAMRRNMNQTLDAVLAAQGKTRADVDPDASASDTEEDDASPEL